MVVGWYHSHPGFGCWLSGVDINTQHSFEALNQRAVSVVIDPIQSVKGKVPSSFNPSIGRCEYLEARIFDFVALWTDAVAAADGASIWSQESASSNNHNATGSA